MDSSLAWAILGLALVIAELVTGTFYLLMLGVAAFGAAGAAWLALAFGPQIIVFALVAAAGCFGVHVFRARSRTQQMPSIDAGNPAAFESWIDQGSRRARVRYRGASWEAKVEGVELPQPGAMLFVLDSHGNTLTVTTQHPA